MYITELNVRVAKRPVPERGTGLMAEMEGFEPSKGVNPYLLSREAH